MPYEYDFNVDFDLSLRPRWGGPAGGSKGRQIDEMAFHALLAGDGDDSVRLPTELPREFVYRLERHGIQVPRVTVRPEINCGQSLVPFGWNHEMADLNSRYDNPVEHPRLGAVRSANSRVFGAEVERDLDGEQYHLGESDSIDEVQRILDRTSDRRQGWVVKANHGNAGLGNRRLKGPLLSEADRRWLRTTLADDRTVLLEPWHHRVVDLCVTFDLSSDGRTHDLMVHEVINTTDGSFIGALFDRDSTVAKLWKRELDGAAAVVADRLTQVGYFGPVCFDAYVWDDADGARLRPLADVNARLNVSRGAKRTWQRWGRDAVLYWRLFNRRKLRLPEGHAELEVELAEELYDSDRRRGILVTSPLWEVVDGSKRQLRRLGVFFVGRSRTEVMERERWFRERFER